MKLREGFLTAQWAQGPGTRGYGGTPLLLISPLSECELLPRC